MQKNKNKLTTTDSHQNQTLDFSNNNKNPLESKLLFSQQEKREKPQTYKVESTSILARVQNFLPQIQLANEQLKLQDPKDYVVELSIESIEKNKDLNNILTNKNQLKSIKNEHFNSGLEQIETKAIKRKSDQMFDKSNEDDEDDEEDDEDGDYNENDDDDNDNENGDEENKENQDKMDTDTPKNKWNYIQFDLNLGVLEEQKELTANNIVIPKK
eukprot:TRINITY_DN417_c0_g5_i1.p1 TRINITY_DN417_c0_g5~~TRINITY_DN417_c0_g5_i1.p1  ORF type:complete len:236 (-),score=109.18 TRINITY_DN417_c0_g5_i1:61-702(-)